mmetsp:Transcript_199/g.780  ORF Transcript_199/g.780 Transcript_199/m.780 type:complete len:200 (-) Transcript_199:111-710(-)
MSTAATPPPGNGRRSATPLSRKLTKEELEKAVERLSRPATPAREPEPLPLLKPHLKLSADEQEETAQRLCNGAVERKQHTIAQLEERFLTDSRPKSVMSSDERDASVQRLYYGAVRTNQAKLKELKDKLLHPRLPKTEDAKAKADHSVQSLYYEEQKRRAERESKLRERYVACTGPRRVKVSADRIAKMVERLGTAGGN